MENLPRDGEGVPLQITPAVPALARTVSSSLSSSLEITLNTATTIIRVYATTQDVYLKWGTDNATAANFDEICPAGQVMDFAIPAIAGTRATAINLLERTASAAIVVIEK